MVGGQMLDLAAEGRFDGGKVQKLGAPDVELLQTMKTGALLRFGCLAGAILGEATPQQREALDRYGTLLGEAFQIADDLLDVEGDAATVGKATGKDAAVNKGTFVSVLGLDQAKARLKDLVVEAEAALAPFGRDADVLKMAARFVAERKA
jgi:farnesyl diphosphate synthase